jgi:hypothetical protein
VSGDDPQSTYKVVISNERQKDASGELDTFDNSLSRDQRSGNGFLI